MTSRERLDAFYRGEKIDRMPNLTIVGSMVTQYNGIDLIEYTKDYRKMTEAAILAARDLKLDFVQIAADLCREAEGYGSEIEFTPDLLPTVKKYALDDISKVSELQVRKACDIPRLMDLVEATALALKEEPDIYPMTLAVGPASVAGNIRGLSPLLKDTRKHMAEVDELLAKVTETLIDYINELAKVGAKYVYIADPTASLFHPKFYAEHVLPYHQKLYSAMKERGIGGRLHMCGNTLAILPYSKSCGAKIIDVDHVTDFKAAVELVDNEVVLNGNIDPFGDVFSCDAAHTKAAILSCAEQTKGHAAMFMPGCELPTKTPIANVKAIHEALVEIGCTY